MCLRSDVAVGQHVATNRNASVNARVEFPSLSLMDFGWLVARCLLFFSTKFEEI